MHVCSSLCDVYMHAHSVACVVCACSMCVACVKYVWCVHSACMFSVCTSGMCVLCALSMCSGVCSCACTCYAPSRIRTGVAASGPGPGPRCSPPRTLLLLAADPGAAPGPPAPQVPRPETPLSTLVKMNRLMHAILSHELSPSLTTP